MKNLKKITLLLLILAVSLASCKHDDAKPALKSYLNSAKTYDDKGNLIMTRNYSYDANGLVTSVSLISPTASTTENYTYDATGKQSTYSTNLFTTTYTYDGSGNLTKAVKVYNSNSNKIIANYTYSGNNVTVSKSGNYENGNDATATLSLTYTNGNVTNNNG